MFGRKQDEAFHALVDTNMRKLMTETPGLAVGLAHAMAKAAATVGKIANTYDPCGGYRCTC